MFNSQYRPAASQVTWNPFQIEAEGTTKSKRTTHTPDRLLLAKNVHVLLAGKMSYLTSWVFVKL